VAQLQQAAAVALEVRFSGGLRHAYQAVTREQQAVVIRISFV